MRAEAGDQYYAYFQLSDVDYASGLDVKDGVNGVRTAVSNIGDQWLYYVLYGTSVGAYASDAINALIDSTNFDVSDSVASGTVTDYSLHAMVVGDSGRVYFNDYITNGREVTSANVCEDVTVTLSLSIDENNVKGDDRNEVEVMVYPETEIGSGVYDANGTSIVVKKGTKFEDVKNFPLLSARTWDEDGTQYRLVFDKEKAGNSHTIVYGNWEEYKEGMGRFSPAATNDKDTNGDGKVSCDEYYGTTGLEWSDKLNACVVSSTGDAVVTIPNTATK